MEGRRSGGRQGNARRGAVSSSENLHHDLPVTNRALLSVSRDNLSRIDDNADLPPRLEAQAKRFQYMLDRDPLGANFLDFNPEEYQRYLSKKKDVDMEPDFETTGLEDLYQTAERPLIYRGPENTDFYTPPAPAWRDYAYKQDDGGEPGSIYPPVGSGEGRNLLQELGSANWPAPPPGEDGI